MMRLPQLGGHRSALVTAGAVTAVVAVIAGVAVASGGYAAQRVDLGDASVWVANDELQAVGRANTAVLELNSVVETGGSGAEIVQQGSTVLVLDRDRASVGIVDATTSTVTETVPVPPEDSSLALAGDRVVVAADGKVWSAPAAGFADFDGDAEPVLNFGPGAVTSVDPAGRAVRVHAEHRRGRARRRGRRGDRGREMAAPARRRRPRRADHLGRRALGGARLHGPHPVGGGPRGPAVRAARDHRRSRPAGSGTRGRFDRRRASSRSHHRRPRRRRAEADRRRRRRRPGRAHAASTGACTPRGATARPGADAPAGTSGPSNSTGRPAPATSPSP